VLLPLRQGTDGLEAEVEPVVESLLWGLGAFLAVFLVGLVPVRGLRRVLDARNPGNPTLVEAVERYTQLLVLVVAVTGALVAGILAFRRLPMVVALRRFVPPLDHPEATAFVGWFGPIGVAALFYATLAVRETGIELVWPVVSLVVAGSILAHGVTATPITVWYGGREEDTGTW
jgi:hypothetical protein